ncbi:hypothetical protein E4T82_08315 [Streptococcus cuniculi]|uniref:Uncharacterized protein n=2 Tax=Streptococcus cuniculi TaxID=1432788 RepID=A0A4Y9J986_9STRE|nr:hypothetical protein [Streptococcus cuniculi]MBF0778723.1 hypothetical protein [Streptococcus cuniculi]TFU97357.1 hypothetical protein E4T82_08315 [Streptococcus cuniculi]
MTKAEANQMMDYCYVHLMVMKHYYEKTREFELDIIEKANLEQIDELLSAIQNGIDRGYLIDMEVTCINDDATQLWEEVSQIFSKTK